MKTRLIHLALASALSAILTVSGFAQEKNLQAFSPAELTERTLHRRAIEAVIWGMPAVNFDLMFQAMARTQRRLQPDRLLVAACSTGRTRRSRPTPTRSISCRSSTRRSRSHRPRDPAGRRTDRSPAHRRCWQTALEDVGPAGVDKGNGGKYLILPPGYKETLPDGYIALPSETYAGYALLRSNPEERRRRRRREGRRLRQADQALSAVASGQPAADQVRRCDRHRLRLHDPLRSALLPGARPRRAERAVARARQGHDRSAQVDRHREGQAVQSRRRTQKILNEPRAKRMPGWI